MLVSSLPRKWPLVLPVCYGYGMVWYGPQKTFFTKHPSHSSSLETRTNNISTPKSNAFSDYWKTWKRATPPRRHPRHEKKRTHLLVLFHTIKGPMSTPRNPLTTRHTVPHTRAHTHTHFFDSVSPDKVTSTVLSCLHKPLSCNLCNPICPHLTPCFPCLRTNNGIAPTRPAHNPTLMPH